MSANKLIALPSALLYASLIFWCIDPVWAQRLQGVVRDAKTGEPLIGSTIVLQGSQIGTVTDEEGRFMLRVPTLPATLVVSHLGHVTRQVEVHDTARRLVIKLNPDVVMLGEVKLVASRVEEKNKQAPLTVESMDQIAIKETPAFNFYEGLGHLKGIDVVSAALGFKIINARGFNSTSPVRMLQLIDGVDNQAPGLNFSLGNFLGASDLDVLKVELTAGASSAFYGPNAFNGVISMITKNPVQTPGLTVSLKYGERQLFEGAIRWAQVVPNRRGDKKFAYKLNGYLLRAYDWEATNTDPVFGALDGRENPGGYDAVNRYGDEFYFANDYTGTVILYPGLKRFYRTGYMESDLVDYNTRNYKASAELHYLITDSLRLVYASHFGSGTTVYQGENRYSLKDVLFFQNRLELRKPNRFFVRAYATNENAGRSYDAYFTALLLQRYAKSDIQWGPNDYATYWATTIKPRLVTMEGYPQYVPGSDFLKYLAAIDSFLSTIPDQLFAWHAEAAHYANFESLNPGEAPFYVPGTLAFDSAFHAITSRESFAEGGSRFFDRSALYHLHGERTFSLAQMRLTVGANARMYRPNSRGTIFSDTAGRIIINREWGIYAGIERSLFQEKLTLQGSARLDKNENFPYLLSPAVSAVYKWKKHVWRLSFSAAIRNPTLADQYLYYNVGRAILVGNVVGFDSLVTIPSLISFFNTQRKDTLDYFNVRPVRPEEVKTIEVGFRTSLFQRLYADLGYYFSWYRYFIGYKLGATIVYNSIFNRVTDFTVYRVASNTDDMVTTQGFAIGLHYYFGDHYTLSGNYSYNVLDLRGSTDPIIPAYNTPAHKFNIGLHGRNIENYLLGIPLRRYGFSINYRWQEAYLFEGSPQFTGMVPTFGKVDVQINKNIEKPAMMVKVGASNLLNNRVSEAYGGPAVGRLAYLNVVFTVGDK